MVIQWDTKQILWKAELCIMMLHKNCDKQIYCLYQWMYIDEEVDRD